MTRYKPCLSVSFVLGGIPCFFPCEEFLAFLSVFPFFSREFRGSLEVEEPCFLRWFRKDRDIYLAELTFVKITKIALKMLAVLVSLEL